MQREMGGWGEDKDAQRDDMWTGVASKPEGSYRTNGL